MKPADLRDLDDAALLAQLTELAEARYGKRWQAALAREFGFGLRTVNGWARGERRAPLELVIALHFLQHPPPVLQLAKLAQLAQLAKLAAERMETEVAKLTGP